MITNYYLHLLLRTLWLLELSLLRKVPEGLDLIVVIPKAPAITFGLRSLFHQGLWQY